MEPEEIRLYISVPSNRDWKAKFSCCFLALTNYLTTNGTKVPGYRMTVYVYRSHGNSSLLSAARHSFVDEAISGGYTHWLSLDDDMTFPPDIVDRLLSHKLDVVSCNARHKTNDMNMMLGSCLDMSGRNIDSTDKTGIQELMAMGGAIFLAKVDAFRNIPKPHFQVVWSETHQAYVGEDFHFAYLLRAHNIRLWCDHDTTQQIGHIGEHEYRYPSPMKMKIPVLIATYSDASPEYYAALEQAQKRKDLESGVMKNAA